MTKLSCKCEGWVGSRLSRDLFRSFTPVCPPTTCSNLLSSPFTSVSPFHPFPFSLRESTLTPVRIQLARHVDSARRVDPDPDDVDLNLDLDCGHDNESQAESSPPPALRRTFRPHERSLSAAAGPAQDAPAAGLRCGPEEVISYRLRKATTSHAPANLRHKLLPVIKQVVRDDGVLGLWRGTEATVAR